MSAATTLRAPVTACAGEAVDRTLAHYIWADAPAEEIADYLGVPVGLVRNRQARRDARLSLGAIFPLARELAVRLEWEGDLTSLVVSLLTIELRSLDAEEAELDARTGRLGAPASRTEGP